MTTHELTLSISPIRAGEVPPRATGGFNYDTHSDDVALVQRSIAR